MAASRSFSVPRGAVLPRPRAIPPRALLAILAAAAIGVGGWMWLRDSSLVAVEHVTVRGATGPQAGAIREAVEGAARDMTTLHVRAGELRTAVEPYPIVDDVRVRTDFPHGMTVEVIEHRPVAQILAGGRHVPVAGDGTMLRGAIASDVPVLPLKALPGGERLTRGIGRRAVTLLAAAPPALLSRTTKVFAGPRGLTIRLRRGPSVAFGGADRAAAKWMALAAVLADGSSHGATSIDVRVPERPAAAGLEQEAAQESVGEGAVTPAAGAQTTPSAVAPPATP